MERLRGTRKTILRDERQAGFDSVLWFAFRMAFMTILAFILLSTVGYILIRRFVVVAERPVPNVVGLTPSRALKTLTEKKFTMTFEKYEFSSILEEERIISQYPQSGVPAKIGSPVRVVLSKGSPLVIVPDVRGETEVGAGIKIRSENLQLGDVAFRYDDRVKKDAVIAQDPPPRTGAPQNYPVKLLVSLGAPPNQYVMPSLISVPLSEAREILGKAGLDVIEIKGISSTAPHDHVVSQSPRSGAIITKNARITLSVAR